MTYFILFSYMIPISLFVTIELSRMIQALYMYWDVVSNFNDFIDFLLLLLCRFLILLSESIGNEIADWNSHDSP